MCPQKSKWGQLAPTSLGVWAVALNKMSILVPASFVGPRFDQTEIRLGVPSQGSDLDDTSFAPAPGLVAGSIVQVAARVATSEISPPCSCEVDCWTSLTRSPSSL